MRMKLKSLLKEEETAKKWVIVLKNPDDPYGHHEMVGIVNAVSSSDALQKFYKHDNIPPGQQDDFTAGQADQTRIDKFKKYWENKLRIANRALQNMDIK